jgi:hypothetical protein
MGMMDVGPHSRKRIFETFAEWKVPKEYADPMYNYLVYGFTPGGFFTSVLANDWHLAIMRSHPSNTIEALKAVTGWMHDRLPRQAVGSYGAVDGWSRMEDAERTEILLEHRLILSPKREVFLTLKGSSTIEPILW